jgi:hypothetical protein
LYEAVIVELTGRMVRRDIEMRHLPISNISDHVPTPLMPIDVLHARLSLYGTDMARRLVDLAGRYDSALVTLHRGGGGIVNSCGSWVT